MTKIRALASRCSLLQWLTLSLAPLIVGVLIYDWREEARAWRDLADLGTEPSVILGSIVLGWIHTPGFWALIVLMGLFSTVFWRLSIAWKRARPKASTSPFMPVKVASVTMVTKHAPGPFVFGFLKGNPRYRHYG